MTIMRVEFVPAETTMEREARIAKAQALEDKLFAKRPTRRQRKHPKLPCEPGSASELGTALSDSPGMK